MSGNQKAKPVYLTEETFDRKAMAQAGTEAIVATTKVPSTQVWQVPVGMPVVAAVVHKQTFTVTSDSTESKSLSPQAPKVDYMDDFAAGEYGPEAYVAGYFDSDGDGEPDTLITDSTDTQYTGTIGEDGDFVTSVELSETTAGGDVDVALYTVASKGYVKLQKRKSGSSNAFQSLQQDDAVSWAFSNPDDPESDRQITWDSANASVRGMLPPKFHLDVVYYDQDELVSVEDDNATNVVFSIPMNQIPLSTYDETAGQLRQRVAAKMLE